jgi:hypothetical protein
MEVIDIAKNRGVGLAFCLVLGVLFCSSALIAHPIDISSSVIYVKGKQIKGKIILPMTAVLRYFKGGDHQGVTPAQKQQEIFDYVDSHFQIQNESGNKLEIETREMSFRDVNNPEKMNLQIRFQSNNIPTQGRLYLQNTLFFEKTPTQKNLITIYKKGGIDKVISTISKYRYLLRNGTQLPPIVNKQTKVNKQTNRSPMSPPFVPSYLGFVYMGIEHILMGFDHLLFLFCILLVVRKWKPLLLTITAFTVAHSLTLLLTVLGVLVISSQIAECLIALTIVFVALENLICKNFDKRWKPTFVLGLIHGVGFAFSFDLAGVENLELLNTVLFFNAGVEVGQLGFILILIPSFLLLARYPRLDKFLILIGSLFSCIIGLYWFLERSDGLSETWKGLL